MSLSIYTLAYTKKKMNDGINYSSLIEDINISAIPISPTSSQASASSSIVSDIISGNHSLSNFNKDRYDGETPKFIHESLIIKFGKHKSKSVYELKDANYMRWCLRQPFLESHKEIKKYFENYLKENTDITLSFGKYKGKTLDFIKKEDKKYIDWLKNSEYVNKNLLDLKKQLENY